VRAGFGACLGVYRSTEVTFPVSSVGVSRQFLQNAPEGLPGYFVLTGYTVAKGEFHCQINYR
jgi:hypothetical protein